MASLRMSRKARVKLVFCPGWSHTYSWGLGLPVCLVFTMADDVGATMVQGIIILATSTPVLRSLARCSPSCSALQEVYALRPSPIGHKCVTGQGVHGPLLRHSPRGS
jgi:hypothetical protein